MNSIRSNSGSFSIFMCIVLSSIILIMSILVSVSRFQSNKLTFNALMYNENDYIKSNYSEILQDRYGIFATNLIDNKTKTLPELMKYNNINISNYKVQGIKKLENEELYNSIISFSNPRLPIALANDFLSRYISMSEIIKDTKNQAAINNQNKAPYSNRGEYDFYKIISIINSINFSKYINEKKLIDEGISLEEMNKMFLNFENSNMFEVNELKSLKSNLFINDSTINNIATIFDNVYDFDFPEWYEKISFEQYIYRMFSCKVNYYNNDNGKIFNNDLRNRKIDNLYKFDDAEIEKIIFGFDDSFTNEFFAKMSIQSLRTMLHILSYLIDESKLSKIKVISVIYCGIISIVTSGSISIPPEVMDIVLLIVFSTGFATVDYLNLIKGNSVKLIPLNLEYNIDTFYKDYLFLFQLVVPESKKLERINKIIKTNTYNFGNELYTEFSISAKFNEKVYKFSGGYYD